METANLSVKLTEAHPAYQWAKRQSDSVNAMGHIGTHIDCYTREPLQGQYHTETVVVDCSEQMPDHAVILPLDIEGKALVLYTANLENHGYGNDGYGKTRTVLDSRVLDLILEKNRRLLLLIAMALVLMASNTLILINAVKVGTVLSLKMFV